MKIKWQELFNHMSQDHGLDLLETEMNDIAVIVERPLRARIKKLEDDAKQILNRFVETLDKILEAVRLNQKYETGLVDDVKRLIEHSAVLGLDLRDGDSVDASTESWVSLPDHLQEAINVQETRIEAEDKER